MSANQGAPKQFTVRFINGCDMGVCSVGPLPVIEGAEVFHVRTVQPGEVTLSAEQFQEIKQILENYLNHEPIFYDDGARMHTPRGDVPYALEAAEGLRILGCASGGTK